MVMLVFIRDLGSSLMFFGAFLAMIYVATARISFVVVGLAMFFVGAWFFANTVGHVQDRFDIWLDPFDDASGSGYQIAQSLFAQADGGLSGRGLGESLVQLPGQASNCPPGVSFPDCDAILPAPHTDFIYAVIVNELGLFGGAAVVLIYALIAERGFKTAILAEDGFSKLLATGSDGDPRAAGLRDHRRRHPGDPADRRHPAVHQLRRQLDRRQLRPARAAAADLRQGAPPGPAGVGRRGCSREPPDREALRVHRRALRAAVRLHLLLVVFDAEALEANTANKRPLLEQQQIERGDILASDGVGDRAVGATR